VTPPYEELLCLLIVAGYFGALLRRPPPERRWALQTYALIACAGWLGEESCIRAYGFYGYSPEWILWLDLVPVVVVLVWPVVILSALELARSLAPGRPVLLCAGIVLADAALIEPVAVRAGLWSWTQPGLFGVPPIGVLGWSWFTLAAALWLERTRERPRAAAALLVVAPLACHLLLLASWWGGLRWVAGPLPDWVGPAVAWPLSLALTVGVVRSRVAAPLGLLLARLPGALLFFVLLGLHGREDALLVAYVVPFALPYLVLSVLARRRPAPRGRQRPH
jgi:Carotenoid biosynthesis protein